MIQPGSDLDIRSVAVVDDNPGDADLLLVVLEECGYNAVPFTEGFNGLDDLVEEVKNKSDGVLCDHRLSFRTHASFCGAEAVAGWFDRGHPAILVSSFSELDASTTIRKWRRKIPVVLPKSDIDPDRIRQGFRIVQRELLSDCEPFRIPRRAIVRINDVRNEPEGIVLEAFIPQWEPKRPVRFPFSLLGELESHDLKCGTRLIADVNIGARSSEELFLCNFELAPEPDPNDGLA